MNTEYIDFEMHENVGKITLARPDVLNSFNTRMSSELVDVLHHCADDVSIRAVIVTGAGKGFCAGQDLAEVVPSRDTPMRSLGPIVESCYNPVIRSIRGLEKPVVAAVNGVAAGAGANVALACDFVVASDNASFIQSFSHVGLIPDSGGTFFLPRIVGFARATEMMMLGEKVSAADAHQIGMIYRVVPLSELHAVAGDLAERLSKMPTRGLGLIKRGLNATFGNSLDEQLNLEVELQQAAGETEDYREGVTAFLEKRTPTFKGQ